MVVFGNFQNIFLMFKSCSISESRTQMILSPFLAFLTHHLLIGKIVYFTNFCSDFQILIDDFTNLKNQSIKNLLFIIWINNHSSYSSSLDNTVIKSSRHNDCVRAYNVTIWFFRQIKSIFASRLNFDWKRTVNQI